MKCCFVTGGAGFIGSNFIFYELKKHGKNQENKREKIIKNAFKNNLTKNNAKN